MIWELLYLRHFQGIESKDKTVEFKEEKYLGLGGGGRGCGQRWAGKIAFVTEFCSLVEKGWCEC